MGDTSLLAGAALAELEKLTAEFPYCQATHLLYVKALSEQNSIHYHAQLKKTAAHVSDRSILYYLIQSKDPSLALPPEKKVISAPVQIEKATIDTIVTSLPSETKKVETGGIDQLILRVKGLADQELPDLSDIASRLTALQSEHLQRINDMVKAYLTLRAITEMKQPKEVVEDQIVEIAPIIVEEQAELINEAVAPSVDEPEITIEKIETTETKPIEQEKEKPVKEVSQKKENKKTELIDKFIETAPSMPKPKKDFYSPTNMAHHSTIDNDDLVSETLAEIHLKQGNFLKAIKIYQRLCLIIPEKSTYFAARIEKVKKDNNLL
jgi:hypothetical protein